jgi:hypothetical protein
MRGLDAVSCQLLSLRNSRHYDCDWPPFPIIWLSLFFFLCRRGCLVLYFCQQALCLANSAFPYFSPRTLALTGLLAPTSSRPSSLLRITRDLPVFRVAASATCSRPATTVPSTAVPAAETTCRTTLSCSNFHDTNAHEL